MTEPIETTLARLETMTVSELRAFHKRTFGVATSSRHRVWLVRRIAWRLQADAEGGLSERALARAAQLSEGRHLRERRPPERLDRPSPQATKVVAMPGATGAALAPGTVLEREWKGVIHRAVVHPEGFEYQGRFYDSISAVARAITGTKWNGMVFFGLKKQRSAQRGAG